MEQIQAVGPFADDAQHRIAQHPTREGFLVRHGGDGHQSSDPHQEETAAEQPRVGVQTFLAEHVNDVDLPRQECDDAHTDDRHRIERRTLVFHRSAQQRVRTPHQRQCRAEQKTHGSGGCRQIQCIHLADAPGSDFPIGAGGGCTVLTDARGRHESRHRHADGHGGASEPHRHTRKSIASPTQHEQHHERPQQIELLLDGQRPQMTQWCEVVHRGVTRTGPHLEPVGSVHHTGDDVATQLAQRVAFEERRPENQQHEHCEQSRQQSSRPSCPELTQFDRASAFRLGHQQQGDQISADDEEHLDTEVTPRKPRRVGVIDDDRHDGESPKTIEAREIGHATDLSRS